MRRSSFVLLAAAAVVVGVGVSVAVVPAARQALLHPAIEAAGGVTCDDQRCPPDAGWVQPADGPMTSGFRTADRPDHHGVDLFAERGAEVVAASAGVVTISKCQARLGGEPYGCDQDGSWEVLGCGWFVQILHADRIGTLYCHLLEQPEVSAGDVVTTGELIGYVGSSGNSSAPHLHFEVQEGSLLAPPRSATAIDPEPFLAARDAPLSSE